MSGEAALPPFGIPMVLWVQAYGQFTHFLPDDSAFSVCWFHVILLQNYEHVKHYLTPNDSTFFHQVSLQILRNKVKHIILIRHVYEAFRHVAYNDTFRYQHG